MSIAKAFSNLDSKERGNTPERPRYIYSFHATIGAVSSSSSIYDSTAEVVIQEMIDRCQRSIDEQYNNSMVADEYLKQKMKTYKMHLVT